MPWYWTDDIARSLIDAGLVGSETVASMLAVPAAVRRDEPSIEAAARAMLDEDEIPLAA